MASAWIQNTVIPASEDQDHADSIYIRKILRIEELLMLCVSPILMLGGAAGNTMALVILQSRRFRGTTTSFLLSALAVVDTVALMNGPLRYWFFYLLGWDIRAQNTASCKVHAFVTFLCTHLSAWTIVLVTVERAFLVLHPARGSQIFCRRNAAIAWVVILVTIAMLDSHFFGTYTYVAGFCEFNNVSWTDVWGWIDFVAVCALPFVLILSLNGLVVFQLSNRQRRIRRRSRASGASTATGRHVSSVTRMLVVVSFVFLITTLPSSVVFAGYPSWFPHSMDGRRFAESKLTTTVVNQLFYTNNAINFLLYIVSGRSFRRAFLDIFCKKCGQAQVESSTTVRTRRTRVRDSLSDASSGV